MVEKLHHDWSGVLASPVQARIVEGRVARVHRRGDALKYPWGEELRDEAELARIVAQLVGKPLVLGHPDGAPENGHGMVSDGAKAHVVGVVVSARVDGDYAVAKFLITSDDALEAIAAGIKDLSMGYACKSDENGNQFETRVDHIAVVRRGRCRSANGEACEFLADSAEHTACTCHAAPEDPAGTAISVEKLRTETVSADVAMDPTSGCPCKDLAKPVGIPNTGVKMDELADLQKKFDAAQAEVETERIRAAAAETERDQCKARADASDAALADATAAKNAAVIDAIDARKDLEPEKVRADAATQTITDLKAAHALEIEKVRADELAARAQAVADKVTLLTAVAPIIGKDDKGQPVDLTKMSAREIHLAVIQHVDSDDYSDATKYDDSFVSGVFAGSLKRASRAAGSRADARVAIQQNREAAVVAPAVTGLAAEKQAQDALRARMSSQWTNDNDTEDKE